jgi:hypothetical protein
VPRVATTSLDNLILHTNFSPLQLIDWVDQALLFIHTNEDLRDTFSHVGIRTATDLLENTCTQHTGSSVYIVNETKTQNLATAINEVQPTTPSSFKMTKEMLKTMTQSLKKDPNVNKLASFYASAQTNRNRILYTPAIHLG